MKLDTLAKFPFQYLWVLRRLSNKTHMHPPLRQQISDIVTALLASPALSVNLTSTSVTDMKAFVRVSRVLFRPFTWKVELLNPEVTGRQYDQRKKLQEALDQEEWYASVEDLQRVWTNILRHRIHVASEDRRILSVSKAGVCTTSCATASSVPERDRTSPKSREYHLMKTARDCRDQDDALARIFQGILARCT